MKLVDIQQNETVEEQPLAIEDAASPEETQINEQPPPAIPEAIAPRNLKKTEERTKCKYYCVECDKVFFCSTYFNSHNNSTKHKNMVFIKNNLIIN